MLHPKVSPDPQGWDKTPGPVTGPQGTGPRCPLRVCAASRPPHCPSTVPVSRPRASHNLPYTGDDFCPFHLYNYVPKASHKLPETCFSGRFHCIHQTGQSNKNAQLLWGEGPRGSSNFPRAEPSPSSSLNLDSGKVCKPYEDSISSSLRWG